MSIINETLKANEIYAQGFKHGHLPMPPARKLAGVACMDARLMVDQALGLKTGDAHVIRPARVIVTEDALRSLLISHYLLGTQEFAIINHTDCGMLTFKDEDLHSTLLQATGTAAVAPFLGSANSFPRFRRPPGERAPADPEGKVTPLDTQRHPGPRLHIRRGDRQAKRGSRLAKQRDKRKSSGQVWPPDLLLSLSST